MSFAAPVPEKFVCGVKLTLQIFENLPNHGNLGNKKWNVRVYLLMF